MNNPDFNLIENCHLLLIEGNYEQAILLLNESSIGNNNPEQYFYLGLAYLLIDDNENTQSVWMSFLLSNNFSEDYFKKLVGILENFIFDSLNNEYFNCEVISKVCSAILELDYDYDNPELMELIDKKIEFLKKEALLLALSDKYNESRKIYENIITLKCDDSEILYQLGMVYFKLEEYDKAQNIVEESIFLQPESGLFYDGLGMILEAKSQYNDAIKAYSYAIEYSPKNVESYIKLANLFKKFDLLIEASNVYKDAISNDIKHSAIYMNFANLLVENNDFKKAIELYQKAIELQSDYSLLHQNLALVLEESGEIIEALLCRGRCAYHEGNFDEAVAYFEQYRLLGNGDIDFYNEFGSIYQRSSDFNKRIELHKEAIRKYPDTTRQRVMLINAYQRIGDEREALQTVDEAIAFFDSKKAFVFKGFKQSLLPILYDTEIEINQRRELFLRNSNILINTAKIETDDDKKYAYFLIRNINNYYLHFHAKNDLLIQIQHSTFVAKIMHILFPEFSISREIPKNISEKIRIGYVCHRSHSLGQLFLDWIKYANQEKFEIYFYDIGVAISPQTEAFRVYSHFYYHIPHNIEKVARQIHQDNLHILTFLDIAVEPEMCCLSTLKLATIQCNTWGHPITSGSVQIDYFLGSDAMEPLNAQDHYSEKLIRLPNLGICISQPDVPATKKNRSDFSLPEGKILYLSCQMTAKYLPQYDFIFPEIAKLVPNAYFIFFEAYESEKITGKLKQRLHNAFGKEDLVLDNFCQFIPRVSKDDYFNINFLSDVFLDTIGWSGGLTTIDAIACCLPIVTFPTEFMRGRQSGGMLKIINITETIANDLNEYITIAARLGIDPDWNAEIRSKMQSNKDRLFDDKSCIEALENFYEKIVKEQNIAIEY